MLRKGDSFYNRTYTAAGSNAPICWWGFSSTSRFHDIVAVKGETTPSGKKRRAPAAFDGPRCIPVPPFFFSALFDLLCPSPQRHLATCVDPSPWKIIPQRGRRPLAPPIARRIGWAITRLTSPAITSKFPFGPHKPRHRPGRARDRELCGV